MADGEVTLDMRFYCIVSGRDLTIYESRSLLPDPKSEGLGEAKKRLFHTAVAKLLYLSKRVRPDIILIIGFLCPRVKAPTKEDWGKLCRLLGYLKGTHKAVMKMKPSGIFKVVAHIDTSSLSQPNGKLQSGAVIKVGGVSVYFS